MLRAGVSAHQMLKPFLLDDAFPASEGSLGLHEPVIELSDFHRISAAYSAVALEVPESGHV